MNNKQRTWQVFAWESNPQKPIMDVPVNFDAQDDCVEVLNKIDTETIRGLSLSPCFSKRQLRGIKRRQITERKSGFMKWRTSSENKSFASKTKPSRNPFVRREVTWADQSRSSSFAKSAREGSGL